MFNWGKNLINGFFEDPLGSIVDAVKTVIDGIIYPIRDAIMHYWGEFLKVLYMIWATLASILDTIQVIFNMMVGTSEVVWQSTSDMGKDIAGGMSVLGSNMSGVTHNLVLDVFLSEYVLGALLRVVVLSLFLLLIFTLIAIVKVEYSTPHEYSDPKKHDASSKAPVLGHALKSLLGFVFIPLCCVFGVIASGVLMQALDGATSPTKSTIISNKIFAISAFDANRVRTDDSFYASISDPEHENQQGQIDEWYELENDATWNPNFRGKNRNQLAEYIDDLFIYGTSLQEAGIKPEIIEIMNDDGQWENVNVYRFHGTNDTFSSFYYNGGGMNDNNFFNSKNASQVFYFYDFHHFQWLIAFFTVIYMVSILIRITLGAAGRVFELAILFVISPAILAMAPLDNGEAQKKWSKKFIGKVGMIYAPVIAINLYFILVGALVQVDFTASVHLAITKGFGSGTEIMSTGLTAAFIQQIFNLFILIAGLQVCENAIGWLGDIIGAENIDDAGKKLREGVADTIKTSAAGKVLLSGVGRTKAKATGALSALMADHKRNKEARRDERRSRDIADTMKMQSEQGYNSQIATHQKNLGLSADADAADVERAKTNAQNAIAFNEDLINKESSELSAKEAEVNALKEDVYDSDAGKLDEYNSNYEAAKASYAGSGLSDDVIEAKARQQAFTKTGIRSDRDAFEKYANTNSELSTMRTNFEANKARYESYIESAKGRVAAADAITDLEHERDSTRETRFANIDEQVRGMDEDARRAFRQDGNNYSASSIGSRSDGTNQVNRRGIVNDRHTTRFGRAVGTATTYLRTSRVNSATKGFVTHSRRADLMRNGARTAAENYKYEPGDGGKKK